MARRFVISRAKSNQLLFWVISKPMVSIWAAMEAVGVVTTFFWYAFCRT